MAEESLEESVRKFHGCDPGYNGPENTSRQDPYFLKSLIEKHGFEAVRAEERRQAK